MDTQLLELFFRHSPAGFCLVEILGDALSKSVEYRILHVNASFSRLVDRKNEELVGWMFMDLFHDEPQVAAICQNAFSAAERDKTHVNIDLHMTQTDQSKFLRVFSLDEGHLGIILRDTTKEQLLNQGIDAFLQVNVELFVIAEPSGTIRKANRPFAAALGYDPDELQGRNLLDFIHEDDVAATKDIVEYVQSKGMVQEFVNRYRRKDGAIIELEWHAEWIDGIIYASARDVTKRRIQDLALEKIALTDALTQLYNRHHFYQTLEDAIHDAELKERTLTLVMLDIDFFKRVNDTYGHLVGDQVLKQVADTMQRHIRTTDIAFRLGGEEFAIFLPDAPESVGLSVAKRILRTMNEVPIDDVGFVTASFGVASRAPGESLTRWYARTDATLYRAKRAGRNCVKTAEALDKGIESIEPIVWKSAWESGHVEIDRQHRELVQIGNRLWIAHAEDAKEDAILHLSELIEHCADHFQFEESVLAKLRYAKTEEHRKLHRRLMEKLAALKGRYLRGSISKNAFLKFLMDDLITGHLIEEDTIFFPLLTKPKNPVASEEDSHGR